MQQNNILWSQKTYLKPKNVVARQSNWFVKHLLMLHHACTGCLPALPRLNPNLYQDREIAIKNVTFILFYKTNNLLKRKKHFLFVENMHFIESNHCIPHITCCVGPDWLDIRSRSGPECGLVLFKHERTSTPTTWVWIKWW